MSSEDKSTWDRHHWELRYFKTIGEASKEISTKTTFEKRKLSQNRKFRRYRRDFWRSKGQPVSHFRRDRRRAGRRTAATVGWVKRQNKVLW